MRIARVPLAALISVAALAAGCRPSGDPGIAAPAELRIQIHAEPVSLDPTLAEDGISLKILGNVVEGLVGVGPGGAIEPRLAESHSVSNGGRRLEFRLRPGIAWSDGVPVRAADFVTAFRRALAPETGAKLAPLFSAIKNVSARDDRTVVIDLRGPAPYLLKVLATPFAGPQREDVLRSSGGRWPETAPVTGPYRISGHRLAVRIELEANPRYWRGPSRAGFPRAAFEIVEDESTAVTLFRSGRLDILTRIPTLELERLSSGGFLRRDPFQATYYLSFNVRKPPFDDRDWRRAVAGAVRREEIVQAVASGELPASSWIPAGLEGHEPYADPAAGFASSVARVRGETASKPRRRPVVAAFDSSERNRTVMEKVQRDLRERLGLRIALEPADWKTHVGRITADAPAIYRFGWLAPFSDPLSHLQVFVTGNPNNHSGWSNAEYDGLVGKIASLEPGPERLAAIARAQEILVEEEAAVVPIYHYVQSHAVSARVAGFRADPSGGVPLRELSLK